MQHSKEWWLGAVLSTSIPVIYSFSGGMRASIMTDTTQLVICVGFFIALLAVLGSRMPTAWDWNPNGMITKSEPIYECLEYHALGSVADEVHYSGG